MSMHGVLARIKSFFHAEAVPRWFGFTLVAAYVSGMAALGYGAYVHSRESDIERIIETRREAVSAFADMLVGANQDDAGYAPWISRFGAMHDCTDLRVYDRDFRIIASLNRAEIGAKLNADHSPKITLAEQVTTDVDGERPGARSLLTVYSPVLGTGSPAQRMVQATFRIPPAGSTLFSSLPLGCWLVMLASSVAILIVFHRLRSHLHSIARISDGLRSTRNLEQELEQLRLTDESDALSGTWNRLVDLTVQLREEATRSSASSELLAALSGGDNGELAQALTSAPLGILLVDEQSAVIYANTMARRLCGLNDDSKAGFSGESETSEGAAISEAIASCMRAKTVLRSINRVIEGRDGSFYEIQIITANEQRQLNRFVILISDVSQRVRADRAREEFVSQVTHELRTPLTNIRAYAETLSSGMFDDPKVITECYNVITTETRRLSRLIEDILSISQLEVGTMQLIKDDVDLGGLLTSCVRDVRGLAEGKKIDLQLVLPPKLSPVEADRDKLAVVLNNLLGNAIKYTPSGGQVVVSCQVRRGEVLVAVKDSGIGIDESEHDRIFEKFQRSGDPRVQAETGTGIGLTTAREIARQHDGDITLHSVKGEGATFTLHLPQPVRSASAAEVV